MPANLSLLYASAQWHLAWEDQAIVGFPAGFLFELIALHYVKLWYPILFNDCSIILQASLSSYFCCGYVEFLIHLWHRKCPTNSHCSWSSLCFCNRHSMVFLASLFFFKCCKHSRSLLWSIREIFLIPFRLMKVGYWEISGFILPRWLLHSARIW